MSKSLGKQAEARIQQWLDNPAEGYSFDRFPDQMTGFYMVSRNICDFGLYKYPYKYYIESKSTEHDRFAFSELTTTQRNGLCWKSTIFGNYGVVIVLFITYQRAFIFNIKDIAELTDPEHFDHIKDINAEDVSYLKLKSINIKKIDKWSIPYKEIQTIPSRKNLLEYTGKFEVPQ